MHEPKCPICQKSKHMKKGKELYGKRVCKKCCYGFVNRRQGAFLIDIILLRLLSGALGVALVFLAVSINIEPNTYYVLTWGLTVLTCLIFVLTKHLALCKLH